MSKEVTRPVDFTILYGLLAEFEGKLMKEIEQQVDVIVQRELYFDPENIDDTRVIEQYSTGRLASRSVDIDQLKRYINKLKNQGGDEKLTERLKQQGEKIAELTKKLKEAGIK